MYDQHSSDDAAYAAVLGTVDGCYVSAFAGCVVAVALCKYSQT